MSAHFYTDLGLYETLYNKIIHFQDWPREERNKIKINWLLISNIFKYLPHMINTVATGFTAKGDVLDLFKYLPYKCARKNEKQTEELEERFWVSHRA